MALVVSLGVTVLGSGAATLATQQAPVEPRHATTPHAGSRDGLYADFNGDGYTDIAASVYDEDQKGITDAGIVQVFYGGPLGIGSAGNQIFSQDTPGIPDQAEQGDEFGRNLGS